MRADYHRRLVRYLFGMEVTSPACAAQAVTAALGALTTIGAVVGGSEALTPLGMHLAALPVDVRCVWSCST